MTRNWKVIAHGTDVWNENNGICVERNVFARDVDEAWSAFKSRLSGRVSEEIRWISISVTEVRK